MAGQPACARCAYEASTRPARRVSLAVAFLSIALGGAVVGARRYALVDGQPVALAVGVIGAVVVAVAIAASGRSDGSPDIENRVASEEPAEAPPAGVAAPYRYRAFARRALMAASPRVSGGATAFVMLACFAASAVLLPASLRLPRWVEVEVVLGAWWIITAGVLATLLYRGFRLRDDFVYFAPWNRPESHPQTPDDPGHQKGDGGASKWSDGCAGLDGCSGVDGEGCAVVLGVVVALAVAFGAAWVLVEYALPLVFFAMYGLFTRAISRVANDRHACEGALVRAIAWGSLWATAYLLPLALVTWCTHALR